MPWTLLFSFLGSLPGALGKYFDNKTQVELQKQQNLLEIEKQRGDLIRQGIITQGELGQEQIKATKPWFKQLMYSVILSPIVITCFDPEKGQRIFASLNIVPEWYIFIVSTISLAIWGINSDKVQGILQARREYKLEKLRINRKAYFDAKRELKGFLTPKDVEEGNKILDKVESENG